MSIRPGPSPRRRWHVGAGAASVAVALVVPPLASAGPDRAQIATDTEGPIVVRAEACGTLQTEEVARLLRLELRSVTDAVRKGPPLHVHLHCRPERLHITVVDPLTHKRIERNIAPLAEEPGRERVAALAIGQLFSASWMELLLPDPPPEARPIGPPPDDAVRRAATRAVVAKSTPPRSYALLLGAGVRGRSLESGEPFAASRLDLTFRAWLSPSVAVVGQLGWDFGQALRNLGGVRAHAVGAATGLGWRYRPGQIAGIGGQILVGSSWVRLHGRPSQPDAIGSARSGATGEILTSAGPRIRTRRLVLDVDLETGAMLRTPLVGIQTRDPNGTIVADEPVTLGGLWIGAVVRIGIDLTPARGATAGRGAKTTRLAGL